MGLKHTRPTRNREVVSVIPCSCNGLDQATDGMVRAIVAGFVFGAVTFLLSPASADELEIKEAKPPAKAVEAKPVEAKQVLEVFEALGNLVNDVAAVAGGAPIAADPLEQQFAPQVKLVLNSELHFVQKVCQPTPIQFATIKQAGDRAAKLTTKKMAQVQKKMQQGVRPGQQFDWPDPRSEIAELLVKAVANNLSAEQTERYQLELTKRSAARKRVALFNLVFKIDKDLLLTTEQRTKVSESLEKNWKSEWGQQLEVFVYGDQFSPILPDDQVVPFLNEKQKVIWKGLPKNANQIWGWLGMGFIQGGVMIDGDVMMIEENVEEKAEEKKDATPQDSKKKEEGS